MEPAEIPQSVSGDPPAKILEVLREVRDEISLSELLDRLREKGLEDQVAIKAAIWRLISEGEIELTSKRNLKINRQTRGPSRLSRRPW